MYVGIKLYGFCGGIFGREAYGNKIVEGIGKDWIVVRDVSDHQLYFAEINPNELLDYTNPPLEEY